MTDLFHLGSEDAVSPDTAQPASQPSSSTEPDLSYLPEARTQAKGPDGEGYVTPGPSASADFWTRHSGPQANPASTFSVVSEPQEKPAPPVGAALYSPPAPTPAPSMPPEVQAQSDAERQAAETAMNQGNLPAALLHRVTDPAFGALLADVIASGQAAIKSSSTGLSYSLAQEEAIERTNDAIKDATGVALENPAYGGYHDQAIAAVNAQAKQESWGTYLDPRNPEGLFGGDRYWALVRQKQNDLWDQARQDLAKNRGGGSDVSRDLLIAISAEKSLGDLTRDVSDQYGQLAARAGEKAARYNSPFAAAIASLTGQTIGGFRDPANDVMLAVPAGRAATLGERFASPALRWAGNTAEHAINAAIVNMGLTAVREPEIQETNRALGRESGLSPAIKDMGDSAVYGAVAGGFFGGLHSLVRLFGPSAGPWIDEFVRQAQGMAPNAEMSARVKAFTDDVHAWERENGLKEGSTYTDAGLHDWGSPGAPPAAAGPAGEPRPSSPGGAPLALEPPGGVKRPYPTPPEVPESVRDRPSITSITPGQVEQAMNDFGTAPPREEGVPASEQLRVFRGLVEQAESPGVIGPPEPPMRAPPARDSDTIPPDTALTKAGSAGERIIDRDYNLPVYRNMLFDPRITKTDADTYQYKGNSDAKGVTGRLSTVAPRPENWSDMAAGNAVVHERLNGDLMVGDGHQRDDLLKRIVAAAPDSNVKLPGFLLREADGWTPEMVRAVAAKKNLREGIGEPMDIARVLRDSPQIWDDSIPIGRKDLREGRGLANLSDGAWGMVLNKSVNPEYAALVGNMVPDSANHVAVMDDIAKFKPRTPNEARLLIADANEAGVYKESQSSLFGDEEVTKSLRPQRMRIFGEATKILRSDNRVFSTLAREADRIEAEGNVLTAGNADIADRAGQLMQGLEVLASRAGPISAGLNRAASRIAAGESTAVAARVFVRELPDLLRAEGLRLANPPPAAVRTELDTPKGREEQTAELEAEFMRTQPTMFGEAPKTPDEQRQAIFDDVKQKLLDAGRPLNEAEANATLWAARYATRAARLGRGDPEAMYRNEGVIVRGGEAAQAALDATAPAGRSLNQEPATVPTFYSAALRAVTDAKQAKASPEQWLATVRNTPGVKPEEMKFLGLEDWLKGQKGPISRDDVGDFIRANSLQIDEVNSWPTWRREPGKHRSCRAMDRTRGRRRRSLGSDWRRRSVSLSARCGTATARPTDQIRDL